MFNSKIKLMPKARMDMIGGAEQIIPHLTFDDFNKDLSLNRFNKGKTVIMFYMPGCSHCVEFKPKFLEAYTQRSNGVNFALVDITSEEGSKIQDLVNSQRSPKFMVRGVPKVVGYLNGKFYAVYAPGNQSMYRTAKDVLMFANGIGVIPVEKDNKYAQ
jgi:glutaredoxin